ncbi:ATP synthase protein I-like membrane protein [hydrothermal vent metagenome]|uniref:ATP synthase protein I-like membrane protein n=1 Tax=hydrothermal vent metagenome TaxID=652676 RepID=A0A3B1E0S7_9ZZZZ
MKPKHQGKLQALDNMSLGISIVVAILVGIGMGSLLREWTGYIWTLWLGIFWGIAAAILNVYKAYSRVKKDLDKLAKDPRYQYAIKHGVKETEDD